MSYGDWWDYSWALGEGSLPWKGEAYKTDLFSGTTCREMPGHQVSARTTLACTEHVWISELLVSVVVCGRECGCRVRGHPCRGAPW